MLLCQLIANRRLMYTGTQQLGEGQRSMNHPHPFNFRNRQGAKVSVSNITKFRNYTDQKFHNFYRLCYNFWTIYGGFPSVLTTQGKQITSYWTFRKGPILKPRTFEKFLIVVHLEEDHSEQDFKRNGKNPGSTKKVL